MRKVLLAVIIGLLCPGFAYAVNNTITTATPAVPGHVHTQAMAASAVAYYAFVGYAGRSYAAACWMPTLEGSLAPGVIANGCVTSQIRNNSDTAVPQTGFGALSGEPDITNGLFATFIPTGGTYFFRVVAGPFASGTMRIVIFETTLFSPWYFVNAASGYEAFVEIKNNISSNVSVTVTAFNGAGASQGSTTVVIAANGNTAIALGSAFAIAAGSGGVQISHTGPPGAVVANVTTLSGTTGLSFDSPASPRMAWSLFP